MVAKLSNTADWGAPVTSDETMGWVEYSTIPVAGLASLPDGLIHRPASTAVSSSATKSTVEPSTTGTLSASELSRPANSGRAAARIRAESVGEGMMLSAAARLDRKPEVGTSASRWALVWHARW